jgi:hypothetical protein
MRHTGITLMLEAGVNPRVIQKLAGWTSLAEVVDSKGFVPNGIRARVRP